MKNKKIKFCHLWIGQMRSIFILLLITVFTGASCKKELNDVEEDMTDEVVDEPNLSPADGKRVRILNNGSLVDRTDREYSEDMNGYTVVTSEGEMLRGATFWAIAVHPDKYNYATNYSAWVAMQENHMNTVRLAINPYYSDPESSLDGGPPIIQTDEEWYEQIDEWVDWAEALDMYVIIDHHEVGEYTMSLLRKFWGDIAGRYSDREHVLYEIANEPVGTNVIDGVADQSWHPTAYRQYHLDDFVEIYDLIRTKAPKTHVIFPSFATPRGDMVVVVDKIPSHVDWTNASISVHAYWHNSSQEIIDLKRKYPVTVGETHRYRDTDDIPGNESRDSDMDGYREQTQLMEELKIGWISWDFAYRVDFIDTVMIPALEHAEGNGYSWWN